VANAFADQLPIRYIQQSGDLTAQQHGIWLAHQVETKYVAIIADDDMWSRYHLEEAMRSFEEHPSICSYFGQAIVVENKTCHPFGRFSGSFLQVPSHIHSELVDFRILDRRETAINCLANTPLNIWAVVALADAHRYAINTSAGDPMFGQYPSNDRLYIWRLSLQGDIAVGRNVSLFYRRHPESDIQTHTRDQPQELFTSDLMVSKEIARQAGELGVNAYQEWQREYKNAINYGLLPERIDFWNPMIRDWLLSDPRAGEKKSEQPLEPRLNTTIKKWFYLLSPPIALILLRKAKLFWGSLSQVT
jgi:hypothetical protein